MRPRCQVSRVAACAWLLLACTACGSPPNKEMDQAQGAIDAARAAGAERYAAAELKAAGDALDRSRTAVDQRDYRQALADALESREHAYNAARDAAVAQAEARGNVARAMAEVATLLGRANALVTATPPDRGAAGRARTRELHRTVEQLTADVQEVGEAVRRDEIAEAEERLAALKARLEDVLRALPAADGSGTPPRASPR